jgi:[ribosomal protein S5]-alanine N-acetyltransferase
MELIPISKDGKPEKEIENLHPIAENILTATVELYKTASYELPWVGYLVLDDIGECIGTCAFKSPPTDNSVQIAYFTFPEYEGRGYASRMANNLVHIALKAQPGIQVIAQTLPEENTSTSTLKKAGFVFDKEVHHPEDGLVWEWKFAGGQ